MADLVIRGMDMPKTCCQCDFKVYDPGKRWDENGIEQIGAWVCKRTREIIWNTQRGGNCPLVPLPEGHGLKPCPFCGGKAKICATTTKTYPKNHGQHWCYCEKCGATGQSFSDFEDDGSSIFKAIEAWNRRNNNG